MGLKARVRFSHPRSGSREVLVPGGVIGRAGGGGDVQVEGDDLMSRRHGQLRLEGQEVWYEDLGSSNGSWLAGNRLTGPVRLSPGQPVRLGETSMELLGLEADEQPAEPPPP
ncbi:MAG: FHA domain-containing protein, partial [Candidatus Eremiobacterota bacterium]